VSTIAGRTAANDNEDLPPDRIVDEYERFEVSNHPFFVALRERPVDLATMWLLMANLQTGISSHFVRWLAGVIEGVDDPRIASLLAKQLNDELGNGDFRQIHSVLLERFVNALARWRPQNARGESLAAGRQLLDAMTRVFAADPYEGVGALMVSEIFAKKMDKCVGDEMRRQSQLSDTELTWLVIHEVLEVDHADDSRELAALVPLQGPQLAAAWRGARAEWSALWGFLDQMQAAVSSLRLDAVG
jgi:hypothetical protein